MPAPDYPAWICHECGEKYGRQIKGHLATWHHDTCGWCGETDVPCTEPRDFRYPPYPIGE